MSAGPVLHNWSEGTVQLHGRGAVIVTDGDGVIRGYFRRTDVMQFAAPVPPKKGKPNRLYFADATARWPSFPAWVRRGVTAQLAAG